MAAATPAAVQAAWRPHPNRHSIAENVVHCAYWKYAVRRRLCGEKRGSFPLKGSNWFALPEPLSEASWREFTALLESQHRLLRAERVGIQICRAPNESASRTAAGFKPPTVSFRTRPP